MNLTELQLELRSIEEHISFLHSEIEKMKPQTEEEKKADFDKITKLAKQHPINNNTIKAIPIVERKRFINSLAYLLLADEKDIYSRLLYLNRLAFGGGLDFTAENIYKNGLEFEMNDIDKLCVELQQYKHTYLVEVFIMANISENAPVNMLSVIADMAKIMGCDKEEVRVIGAVAKARLLDDLDVLLSLPVPSKNRWSNCFGDYIHKEWIMLQRKNCGFLCVDKYATAEYNIKHPCAVTSRVQTGQIVKKGDVIVSYEEETKKEKPWSNDSYISSFSSLWRSLESEAVEIEIIKRQILAPCDGMVYFINDFKSGVYKEMKDKYLAVYVVSYFDDYKEFCSWYSNK